MAVRTEHATVLGNIAGPAVLAFLQFLQISKIQINKLMDTRSVISKKTATLPELPDSESAIYFKYHD